MRQLIMSSLILSRLFENSPIFIFGAVFVFIVLEFADPDFSCGQPVNLAFLVCAAFDILLKNCLLQDWLRWKNIYLTSLLPEELSYF